jgi:mRNA interferase MazF
MRSAVSIMRRHFSKFLESEKIMYIKRGDIFVVDLPDVGGSVQHGVRPCVVISNDVGNHYSPVVMVSPLTTRKTKRKLPTHVYIKKDEDNIEQDSIALIEQVCTVPKSNIRNFMAHLHESKMQEVDAAIGISLGLTASRPQEERENEAY